ncbi:MAG: hypothetical protein ACE5G7_03280, partial [Candidatus Hydrothermarchaeaceae archaeon]
MKKVILGMISLLIVVGGGAGAVVISAAKNLQAMDGENILVLIVDETNRNEVELGLGMLAGRNGETPFLVDTRTEVQGRIILDMFSSGSFESSCESLLGQEISGGYYEEEGAGVERFQRVITIPTSLFGELAGLA